MIVGICMVKDEADIIGPVVDHMATQVDQLLVADNLSSDDTFDILMDRRESGLPLEVIADHEVAYYQSRKMSALARMAADKFDAEWVVPFDADEIWYSNTHPTIRAHLEAQHEDAAVVEAVLYDHRATGRDPEDPNPVTRMGWRVAHHAELRKVACRALRNVVISQGNHNAVYPAVRGGDLVVRHFPYRSVEQMIRKARNGAQAYKATDLPESAGAHWRQYGMLLDTFGDDAIGEVFRTWFWKADPTDGQLVFDPAPV